MSADLSARHTREELYVRLRKAASNIHAEIPDHEFSWLRAGTVPLTFEMAVLLVKHASTPADVLDRVADECPAPPCENPYCVDDPRVVDGFAYACGHAVDWERQATLLTMLLHRPESTETMVERVFARSRVQVPPAFRHGLDPVIAAHRHAPAEVLASLAGDPQASAVTRYLLALNPNAAEEDRVAASLLASRLSTGQQEVADRLLAARPGRARHTN